MPNKIVPILTTITSIGDKFNFEIKYAKDFSSLDFSRAAQYLAIIRYEVDLS